MGSSDEEEMRRVRTGRGFRTRLERAAAAAGANAPGRGGPLEAAAAAAEAVAAAAIRTAARRATAQAVVSSSSEEEDAAESGSQRKTIPVAAEANLSGVDLSVQGAPCNSKKSSAGRTSRMNVRPRRSLEEVTADISAGTELHNALDARFFSSRGSSQLSPPVEATADSSSDEEALPGPRHLAVAQHPSSDEAAQFSWNGDRPGSSSSTSSSSSRKNTSRRESGSSSRKHGSSGSIKETKESGCEERTGRSTAKAALSAAAAEETAERGDACENSSTVCWRWKRGGRPSGAKSRSAETDEADSTGGEEGESQENEEEVDFLFDQVPEEDPDATGSVVSLRQVERERRQHGESPSPSREGLQGAGKQEEDETHEQPQQQASYPGDERQRDIQSRRENIFNQEKMHGRKKKLSQKKALQDVAECSSSEGEVEMNEEDYETEKERRELGLPLAFGCGAGVTASQGHRATDSVYIKRLTKEPCDSSSGNDDSHKSKDETDSKSSAAADGEKKYEVVNKWRTLQLPVSLEVDIPAHSPAQVSAIAVNLKANRMATGGSDGLVRLWDFQGLHLESLRSYRSFCPAEKHKIEALAFSFRHDMLLVAAGDAVCRVYTAQAAELLHTTTRGDMYIRDAANTKGHTHTVLDCCWHPLEAQQFFSCGLDATVRLWDLNARPYGILQTLPHVACFKAVPSATCASGRAAAGNAVRSSSSDCCTCCVVSPTAASCLVVGCADGSLQLWGSLGSRKVFGRPDAIVRDAHSASPIPASRPVQTTDSGGAASSSDAAASPEGRPDVAGGDRRTAGDPVRRSGGIAFHSTTSTHGRTTAAGLHAGAQASVNGGSEKAPTGVAAIHFFADDRRLISRGEDGSVALWDTRNFKQPVARTMLPSSSIGGRGGLCLSPDEKYVCITTHGRDPIVSEGAVQILLADGLSLVTGLPIGATNIINGHPTSSGDAAVREVDRTGSGISEKETAVKVKKEAQKEDLTDARDSSASGTRAIAKHQMRQPLRILWPQETNQLLVSCTDGSVCVLFDQQMSRKGVLLCVDAAKGSRRRQAAEQEAGMMYTQPYILVPGQLPEGFKETRDGQIIRVKPRGRERVRLFLEKQKTLIPPIPAKEGYAGANVGGGNRSQHLLRQLGLLDPPTEPGQDDDDPVVALRAYAEKVESSGRESQLISRAYADTQPHAVLDFDADEEEAAIAAAVASGAVEESDRLLQQKVRCPRCALRMCQCGYMEGQSAIAKAVGNKRQRV